MWFGLLADQDPTGYGIGGVVTAGGVLLALRVGWLRLPNEVDAWKDRAINAEASLVAERSNVDELNKITREQVIPAVVSMTAATVEATREIRRNRTGGGAGSPTRRSPAR